MAQLPFVSAARPLLAAPAGRGRGPWQRQRQRPGGPPGRANAAGGARRGGAGARVRAAPARRAAPAAVEAVAEERYALGGACRVLAGVPAPLGATALDGGVNFAVYSGGTSAASLCLFTPGDLEAVSFPLRAE